MRNTKPRESKPWNLTRLGTKTVRSVARLSCLMAEAQMGFQDKRS